MSTRARGGSRGSLENQDFQFAIGSNVASIARGLPEFAGIYLDNARGGRAVVMLTKRNELAEDAMRSFTPAGPGIEFVLATHTYEELVTAAGSALSLWPEMAGHSAIGVSVSTQNNGLDVHVAWEDVPAANEVVSEAERTLGVSVHVLGSDPLKALACTRNNCINPMKAGNLVHRGSKTGAACTMAFHVRLGSNEKFLMAGHCGYNPQYSNAWYHQGLPNASSPGYVGNELANGLTASGIKFDIMRVEMPDSQASDKIYVEPSLNIAGWQWPLVGQIVWVSAGMSDRVISNYVIDDYYTYTDDSCNCTAKGTKTSSTPGGLAGDSGSPTYVTPSWNAYAIGLGVLGGGSYDTVARIGDALNYWGLGLVT